MKHIIIHNAKFIMAAAALLLLASCNKNCVCLGYDGSEHSYTSDEVDAHGVTCSNMIFQSGRQFYSVCNWE